LSKRILIHPAGFTGDKDVLKQVIRTDLQDDLNGPSPVWTALARAIDAVRGEEGRKVVLIFTDGHDEPDEFQPRTKFSDALEEAERAEVMVYSVAVPATVPAASGYAFGRTFGGGTKTEPPDKHLREISLATGGGYMAFDWAQNLNETFARVADELHHQYLIGFTPRALDGRSHSITLRLRRRDLIVRGRTSYVAASADRRQLQF
jgi:VWFA-related protein